MPGLTPAIAQVSGSTAQPKGIVTEFNVGRYVMNEDDCRAEGLDFRAYERGVADAAAAFARNMGTAQGAEPPPNLSEYDLGQWWVKEIERRRAEKEAAPTQYGWLSMESVASHIAEQVVSKIAALTPQEQAEPPLVDWKDAVLDALAAWPPMDFPVTTPPREILAAVIKMERDAATYFAREQAEPALPDEVIQLLNHIEDVVDDENWNRIDVAKWNAVTALARKADSKGGAND